MKRIYKKLSSIISHSSSGKGFTLIELLIVIAILGILAAVIIVAINPLEQLARARDSGRESSITQLGNALQTYATNQATNSTTIAYPPVSATWQTVLVTAKEINNTVTVPASTNFPECTTNVQGNICYQLNTAGSDAIIWTVADSNSSDLKANNSTTTTCSSGGGIPVMAWIASQGKTGVACFTGGGPAGGGAGNFTNPLY